MDELIAAAAEKMKMSPSMVKRSAEARAKATGVSVEAILAEWAGVAAPGANAPAAPAEPQAAEPAEPRVAQPAGTPPDTGPSQNAMDAASLLSAAATAQKMPEKMVRRSAEAKAKAQGVSVDSILAEWAGVEAPQAVAPPASSQRAQAAAPVDAAPQATAAVEVIGHPDGPAAAAEVPAPAEAVVPAGAVPRWLLALFLIIPAFAIAYATFLPNGPNCGDAGRLGIDPVTGVAANCDGSAFGSSGQDPYTQGATIYEAVGCVACHGAGGAGGGNFPGFTNGALLTTFPSGQCAMQIEWVTLGTSGWPDPTYGANDKAVGGSGAVMPAWGSTLTEAEIRAVVLYERVAFGGEDLATALEDCAPADAPSADGDPSALGG